MNLGLEGKTAIVTGAAQGLGKSISLRLAGEGAIVVAADLNFQKVRTVERELKKFGPDSIAVKADVSTAKDIDKLVKIAIGRFGRIDILVNNAGICPRTSFEKITQKEWDRVMAVNLRSVFLLCQKVFPYMKKRKYGRVVNIASGAGKIGGVQVGAHYSASKAAIICLTKTVALNGAKFGITANAVCPGVIGTEMTMKIGAKELKKYNEMIPLGRVGTADDVAGAVLFLASEQAGYITGEITDVNGGFIMD